MNKISKDDGFEITDSTDWLETPLRSLAGVDSALRCQVCKDFYTTPMITSCSHTFCSLCIRRCLNNDGKCPACRTQDQELKLRFNGAMQDLVEAFTKARPEVLEHARRPLDVAEGSFSKRDREAAELDEEEAPRKRTRAAGTRTSSRRSQPTPSRQIIQDSDEDDEDFVPGKFIHDTSKYLANNLLQKMALSYAQSAQNKSRQPVSIHIWTETAQTNPA